MGTITIIGLGPGDGRYVTREAWQLLESAEMPIYLRTSAHPVVAELPCEWQSFDALYENSADFQSVYAQIIDTVVQAAQAQDVIYAVPGDPHVGESTTFEILKRADTASIGVKIVRGLSFYEPMLGAINLDGMDGVQVYDAITIADHLHAPINPDAPLLLGQVFSRMLASDLKLTLMAVYPAEHVVQLIHGAGTDESQMETIPLHEIDHSQQIGNLSSLYVPPRPSIASLGHFADTVAILRSPEGCPWDQKQTPQSLRAGFLEEAAEAIDALDRDEPDELCEELGDVLFHIVMQAQMASEAGDFTLNDLIAGVDAKIKRRHPHVWGDVQASSIEDLNQTWAAIKAQERVGKPQSDSILDNIPVSLSALSRSQKIQKRVRKVGFDWPSIDGVYDKLVEEVEELKSAETHPHRTEELGDMLFVMVNLAKWLDIDAETALREANLKFMRRFQQVERLLKQRGETFEAMSFERLDRLWREAKKLVG
ncbi:MAG: nucleoside triphosphate pyrophosphohydrolase [Candidatus Promineifilaceae bacterium]